MKDFLSVIQALLYFLLILLFCFGIYKIIADDHRYTTKDVFIGIVFPPYTFWVGGTEAYRILTTSSEDREFEEKCLDMSEALGLQRKSRLRYCECLVETGKRETCKAKIFIK